VKFTYGYAVRHPNEQCAVDPANPGRTLCGRTVRFLPTYDEDYTPSDLHPKCRDLIFGAVKTHCPERPTAQVEYGVCPVCWGSVAVFDGLVQAHGQVVVRGGRHVVSETRCDGEGMAPEDGT
jgi:hypothetical protein